MLFHTYKVVLNGFKFYSKFSQAMHCEVFSLQDFITLKASDFQNTCPNHIIWNFATSNIIICTTIFHNVQCYKRIALLNKT